ncbi:MAG TPA: N-acetylmuramoyl-L-alanine amidase-like domain-containing protein [Pseudolabrys sp.]|nr:N-acetylmuramoyl-L-alanine amidase-like domain-containing protein [Pseudolabrys sp.]
MTSAITRRTFLATAAGGAAVLAGGPVWAGKASPARQRIAGLIGEAATAPTVAQRIDVISKALVGSPYRGHTLIGGTRHAERFVMRDDVFDCVTFCETVLAAALAREPAQFETQLRLIRYKDGEIDWRARNHYFADWCANNVANHVCKKLLLPGSETIEKRLTFMRGLPPRQASMTVLSRDALFDNRALLATGDIIGFLSQRPGLDYFHTGFIVVTDAGHLILRHAAKSRGRVLDQPLSRFLADNHVHAVTLLRAKEPATVASVI